MLSFSVYIDLPLVLLLVAAFLTNFRSYAQQKNVDTSVDLVAKLPQAQFRIIAFFLTLLAICWLADFAVWAVIVLVFFIGLLPTIIIADQSDGVILLAAASFAREWAFGFPTMILRPRPESQDTDHDIIGKTGVVTSTLKPSGQITINGKPLLAVSDGGDFIESGSDVSVTGFRNGLPCVRKIESAAASNQ